MPAKKNVGGRPTVEINLIELEKLCAMGCTTAEIAGWFGCTERTIETRKRRKDFAEVVQRGKAKGRVKLRRLQWQAAEKGNPALLIWLGKQDPIHCGLGQKDRTAHELSGPDGAPIEVRPLQQMTDAELKIMLAATENATGE